MDVRVFPESVWDMENLPPLATTEELRSSVQVMAGGGRANTLQVMLTVSVMLTTWLSGLTVTEGGSERMREMIM